MIGEPDAGKPHVRFDEGAQETCDIAARLRPTLPSPQGFSSSCRNLLGSRLPFGVSLKKRTLLLLLLQALLDEIAIVDQFAD
jgi:hypothetical protein